MARIIVSDAALKAGELAALGRYLNRATVRLILEAAAPHLMAPVLALHPKTCEINGDKGCEHGDGCPVLVCGPCGESWPCPTVRALLGT